MKQTSFIQKLIVTTIISLSLYSCAVNPVTGKKQFMLVSEEQEKAMGLESNPQILASMGVYKDPKLQAFINEKGKAMGRISHRPNLNYQFNIVDSPIVNAFAVPGGFVYFTRGIMAHFNSEAEFMGVLGHEIGHITARHSVAQQSKQKLYGVGLMGLMVVLPELQKFGNEGMQLLFLQFGRDDESQSDELGVAYSTKVGYDAHQMAGFFSVLKRKQEQSNPQGIPTFLSTHPNPVDRFNKVHREADKLQQSINKQELKVNRDKYLRMIEGLVYGEDPRQGYVENGIFYHPVMKFKYPVPQGWNLQNNPTQVKMAPKDGKALIIFASAGNGDLNTVSQKVLQELKLQVIERKNKTINGFPAIITRSSQSAKNQQGQVQENLRVLSAFIQYNKSIYVFHGLTQPALFNQYEKYFNQTISKFSRLKDYSKINKKPERIRIKKVYRTDYARNILKALGVPQNRMTEVAILNNIELDKKIIKGTLLKTIGY